MSREILMRKVNKDGSFATSGKGVRVFNSMSEAANYLMMNTSTNTSEPRSLVTHIGEVASGMRDCIFGYNFTYLR